MGVKYHDGKRTAHEPLPLLHYLWKDHGNHLADGKEEESAKGELHLRGDRGTGTFRLLLRDEWASTDLHHRGMMYPAEVKD